MQNALKSTEWWRVWVSRTFQIEIRKGGPNNSAVMQNWFSPKKLGSHSLIWEKSKNLKKVLLIHVECIEIYWMTKNLGPSNF